MKADRLGLLLALSTLLFAGAMRSFLSAVYYDNLVALELGIGAAWALALLSPALFLAPALRRNPRATLAAAALALALARVLLAPTRGGALHLPLAAVAAGSFLVLLGAMLPLLRPRLVAPALAGIASGWALDVALVWYGDSADPTADLLGLVILAPVAALLAWVAWGERRGAPENEPEPARPSTGASLLAASAFGAWLFLQFTLAANPYGAARWNEVQPTSTALASLVGLLVGALLVLRIPRWPRAALVAVNGAALLALVDHAFLHSRAFPLMLGALQLALVVDLALLLPRLTPRALLLAGFVALVLHFLYAFTFLFAYVPAGDIWEGQAPALYLASGIALAVAALLFAPAWRPVDDALRRSLARLMLAPAIVSVIAATGAGATIPEPSDDGSVRVLAFNVHQGFSNDGVVDPSVFVRVLEEVDPDIVLLQEADSPRFTSANLDIGTYLAQKLGYHHAYGQPTSAQAFGGAILSRYPIAQWRTYELPSTTDDRYFTEARITVGGNDVWFYAVHLTLPHADREAETDALLAQAATRTGTKIFGGDWNSCPSGLCPDYEEGVRDDVYKKMTATYVDAWVAAGGAVDDPAAYTYDATALIGRIDYVFATPNVRVLSAQTIRSDAAFAASDHLPVLAVVVVG